MWWERLRYTVICITTAVWTCNFFAPVFFHSYKTDPSINTVFMTVCGTLFAGGEVLKKISNKSPTSENTEGEKPTIPAPRAPETKRHKHERP